MSMDHNNTSINRGGTDGGSVTDSELMTAVPIWEQRGKKRRGLGGKRASTADTSPAPSMTMAAEPRSFDDDVSRSEMGNTSAMGAAAAGGVTAASEPVYRDQPHLPVADVREPEYVHASAPEAHAVGEDPVLMAGPIGRTTTTTKRKSGPAPAALALGLVAVAGLGAAGWYATQGGDDGVPELTAGQAVATAPPATDVASNGTLVGTPTTTVPATAPPAAPVATARIETPRSAPVRTASRTRPAAAASVDEGGVNASASVAIPSAPQPYAGATTSPSTSSAAPTTVNPTPAAPPAAIPQTPPVDAAPAAETPAPAAPEPAPAETTETPAP